MLRYEKKYNYHPDCDIALLFIDRNFPKHGFPLKQKRRVVSNLIATVTDIWV